MNEALCEEDYYVVFLMRYYMYHVNYMTNRNIYFPCHFCKLSKP